MIRALLASGSLLLASFAAQAHPGHSTFARTIPEWLHLLLSPDHFLTTLTILLLGIGLALAAMVRQLRRERRHDSR